MASYCPHCGNPSPNEARFCMKCGREQVPAPEAPPAPVSSGPAAAPVSAAPVSSGPPVPAGAPLAPPPPPPPPGYGPGPVQPSPAGVFLGRVFRGDWLASAKAAAWPAGLLLVLAAALAIPSYGQDDEVVVGWSDRLRIALAVLLQGVGGGFEMTATESRPSRFGDSGSSGSSGSGGISSDDFPGYPGGSDSSFSDSRGLGDSGLDAAQGAITFSLVPLTVTVLFVLALCLGARMLRTRGEGLEAAVRVSLLVTGAVLVLGLFAQPAIAGVEVSSSPLLAALGALVISLLATSGVLQRDDLALWLAQRPGVQSTVRSLGTALRALGAVIAICSLVGFVVYANSDDLDGQALLAGVAILPNLGFAVLGLSWGVPVEYDVDGGFSVIGSLREHGKFGLGEIGDEWGGGAMAGTLALGAVCALILGVWAARRSADRREQVLVGVFSLGLILLFLSVSGFSAEMSGGVSDIGGQGTWEFAPSVPDGLLFGLLWVGAATFLGPFVLRAAGRTAAPPVYAPPLPYTPPTPGSTPAPGFQQPTPGFDQPAPGFEQPAAHPATAPGFDQPVPGSAPAPGFQQPAPGFEQPVPHPATAPGLDQPAPGSAPAPGFDQPAPHPATAPGFDLAPAPAPAPAHHAAAPYAPAPHDPYAVQIGPAPEPAPASGERKRKVVVWTATLTAAFVIGGGGAAGVLMLQKDKGADADTRKDEKPVASASPTPSPSQSTPGTPSTSPTADPTAGPSATPSASAVDGSDSSSGGAAGGEALPSGFSLKQDPAGFAVGVMDGWKRRQAGSQIFYEAPTGGAYLQVGIVPNTPMSSYENFLGLEKKHLANTGADYQRAQLTQNTFQGRPGALWEFTHVPEPDESDLRRHVIDQAFVAADGTEYAILAAGRAADWDPDQDVVFSTAIKTFKVG
ncbi:zinc-ribbon domain-containing protein [Streptomyces sp. NPDC051907]|uniref:zinc ribbon domain-containing protein n=1 Tax=Streptomyces sp. NPDC051907 TaxID=3155284 RepID=UPI0034268A54